MAGTGFTQKFSQKFQRARNKMSSDLSEVKTGNSVYFEDLGDGCLFFQSSDIHETVKNSKVSPFPRPKSHRNKVQHCTEIQSKGLFANFIVSLIDISLLCPIFQRTHSINYPTDNERGPQNNGDRMYSIRNQCICFSSKMHNLDAGKGLVSFY